MDFLEMLRGLLSLDPPSKKMQTTFQSPLADSLYSIAGVPSRFGEISQNSSGLSGTYDPLLDKLRLQGGWGQENTRDTFIHEIGHKKDRFGSERKKLGKAIKPPNYSLSDAQSVNMNRTPESKANSALDSYYATEPKEAYAQAFKNAFNFLQETARNPKMDYRKFAGDLEGNTPGMGMIVQDLMKLPIFEKHPLRGIIFTEKKK